MSLLRSGFQLADLSIRVHALGVPSVKAELASVEAQLRKTMTAAQQKSYDLRQRRNKLQLDLYEERRLNRTMGMVASGGIAGMAIGSMAATAAAIRSTANLEDGFAKIQRTAGLTGKAMAEVAEGVRELAREMPLAVTEIQSIIESAAQLGISGKENLMAFGKTIGMLADTTGIAGDKLATDFAKMLNVFKIAATDSEKYASVLAKLSVESTATADDILNMTRRIAGSAATMGMAAEQAMAIAAATIDVGATAEVGGTAWTGFIGSMLTETSKWAEAIGMADEKLKALLRDNPAEGIRQIVAALNSMGRDERLTAMAKLGIDSSRARNTIQSLANAAEILDKHLKSAADEVESGNALSAQFAITSDTLNKQWQLITNEITLAAEALAGGFNKELKNSLKWARETAEAIAFIGGDQFWTRENLETLSDEELKNMSLNRKRREWWGHKGWADAGLTPDQQRLAADVWLKRKEAQDKAFREAQARPMPVERGLFEQAMNNVTTWGGPWMSLAEKFAAKVREKLAAEAERLAEVDAWSQQWLDENVANERQAMLGAFGMENDPELEAKRLEGLRDDGVDDMRERRKGFAQQIAEQVMGEKPEPFQAQFQGVDELWRNMQLAANMGKKKDPIEIAQDALEQMKETKAVADKIFGFLDQNGIIIPAQ